MVLARNLFARQKIRVVSSSRLSMARFAIPRSRILGRITCLLIQVGRVAHAWRGSVDVIDGDSSELAEYHAAFFKPHECDYKHRIRRRFADTYSLDPAPVSRTIDVSARTEAWLPSSRSRLSLGTTLTQGGVHLTALTIQRRHFRRPGKNVSSRFWRATGPAVVLAYSRWQSRQLD
jgi:hypothetical protein